MGKLRIAVLASGRGSNFKAIAEAVRAREINAEVVLFLTDNPEASALAIAKEHAIKSVVVDFKKYPNKEDADLEFKKALDAAKVDLIVLAGYLRIIRSKKLLEDYSYRIINIHPSLLPAFAGGTRAQQDAFDYGCKVSGLTIHFVTPEVDGGQIIHQEAVSIADCKSGDEAAAKILVREHLAYKKVIDSFSKGKYKIEGRRAVFIENK